MTFPYQLEGRYLKPTSGFSPYGRINIILLSSALANQLAQLKMENQRTQGFRYQKKSAANMVSGFRQFLYFTAYFKLVPLPASEVTISLFLEFMSRTVGYEHLKHLLYTVNYFHKALNLTYPEESFQIDTTLQGLKRRLARVPFQVLPITPDIMRKIYKFLDMRKTEDLALWCSYLTAFYGLLRKASTVPDTSSEDRPTCLLRRHLQVDTQNNIVYIYIGFSKTNNFCKRDVIIPVPGNSDPALDLVRHLNALYNAVSCSADEPAFCYRKKAYVNYSTFTCRLKVLLKKAGLDADLFSGHSFRRGGATFLHSCGGTALMIQASGDWSSQCFTRYIYLSEGERLHSQHLMARRINDLA